MVQRRDLLRPPATACVLDAVISARSLSDRQQISTLSPKPAGGSYRCLVVERPPEERLPTCGSPVVLTANYRRWRVLSRTWIIGNEPTAHLWIAGNWRWICRAPTETRRVPADYQRRPVQRTSRCRDAAGFWYGTDLQVPTSQTLLLHRIPEIIPTTEERAWLR